LLLLVEVALGKEKTYFYDTYMEKAANGFDSTFAQGYLVPDKEDKLNGAVVPIGKPKTIKVKSSCDFNEVMSIEKMIIYLPSCSVYCL